MRRFLRNWQLKLLAAFLAGSTWSVVAYAGNPQAPDFRGVTIEHGPDAHGTDPAEGAVARDGDGARPPVQPG